MRNLFYISLFAFLFLSCKENCNEGLIFQIEEKKSNKVVYTIIEDNLEWMHISGKKFKFNDSITEHLKRNNLLYNNSSYLNMYLNGNLILRLDLDCNCGNYIRTNASKVYENNNVFYIFKFSDKRDSLNFSSIKFIEYLENKNKLHQPL